ncbi:MAG: xanthan lyase [Prevotellaceae bacterium]|nr:xanthan lyase [Candidatus Minthosoma caballi]
MRIISIIILCLTTLPAIAQDFQAQVNEWAKSYTRNDCFIRPCSMKSCTIDSENGTVQVVLGGGFQEQHFTPAVVESIYNQVRSFLPSNQKNYELTIETEDHAIEDLVPNYFRKGKKDPSRILHEKYKGEPWVKNVSRPYTAEGGLEGNHIALWQSHGRYLKADDKDWWWQRPRLFCTAEDIYSQTFLIPYIIPMLQNAGAVVFTPRERDWQDNEVIVDNDHPNKNGTYMEWSKKKSTKLHWETTQRNGFAHNKDLYESCDSPFTDGSARFVPAVSSAKEESVAQWIPHIPEEGKYAVYVAYHSYENSIDDAIYKVYHKGGVTEFRVNQQIGGGTWVYLGTFDFDAGEHEFGMVSLSNRSKTKGIVTADAVRFGGGMGNIVPPSFNGQISPSGMPRWAEAAKYSTVWYGFPYSIHTEPFGTDDYKNDIRSRSLAINYLSGGSTYNPSFPGLGVPLDISMAFHTDAGVSTSDEYIGSLGIYMTDYNNGKTGAGLDRYVSRDLISTVMTNLSTDLKKYNWQVRQLWNRDYGECRDPQTPSCILEMLSHQNFADMKRGFDPMFKFDFGRSVYKSIVKFIATEYQRDYVIQPLPITHFRVSLNENKRTATLTWKAQDDPLEPTAKADSYIVYTRIGDQSFDNGVVVKGTSCTIDLMPDKVYSFKVTALNKGGESFPSETLAAGVSSHNKGTVLIVNGFTRLEGPKVINTAYECGFDLEEDPGVQYGAFAGFCGNQRVFSRSKAGDASTTGLGASGREWEGKVVMGNTFDYTAMHGKGIMLSGGHSFTSCSEQALLEGAVNLSDYPILDMIYGVQKQFNSRTNTLVEQYANNGGKVIMSAANNGGPNIGGRVSAALRTKMLTSVKGCGLEMDIYREMNKHSYAVPSPSIITPNNSAFSILAYSDGRSAAIAQQGHFVRLGFPLESITDKKKMNLLMSAFLKFLDE